MKNPWLPPNIYYVYIYIYITYINNPNIQSVPFFNASLGSCVWNLEKSLGSELAKRCCAPSGDDSNESWLGFINGANDFADLIWFNDCWSITSWLSKEQPSCPSRENPSMLTCARTCSKGPMMCLLFLQGTHGKLPDTYGYFIHLVTLCHFGSAAPWSPVDRLRWQSAWPWVALAPHVARCHKSWPKHNLTVSSRSIPVENIYGHSYSLIVLMMISIQPTFDQNVENFKEASPARPYHSQLELDQQFQVK